MTEKKNRRFKKVSLRQAEIVLAVLFFIGAVFLCRQGVSRMQKAYDENKRNTSDKFYQAAYDFEEARHHVSNYIVINLEDIRNTARLEVLKVSDTEFVIEHPDEGHGIISWLEVQGVGVFTVDLMASEFITDFERQYVLVNIPNPVLTQCAVEKTGKQFWKNTSIFNGSVADGVKLSQEQLSEGRLRLEDSMKQSRRFYDAAKEAAESMVKARVKQWNPELPDLEVVVNFIDVDG